MSYITLLKELECVKTSGGGGEEEFALFLRYSGQGARQFLGLANDSIKDDEIFSGESLAGLVFSGGASPIEYGPKLIGLRLGGAFSEAVDVEIRAFGLEIDGRTPTEEQAIEYMNDFKGEDDFGTGNDDILFDHSWAISKRESLSITETSSVDSILSNGELVGNGIPSGGRFEGPEGSFTTDSAFSFNEYDNGAGLLYRVADHVLDLQSSEQCSHYRLRFAYFQDAAFQPVMA